MTWCLLPLPARTHFATYRSAYRYRAPLHTTCVATTATTRSHVCHVDRRPIVTTAAHTALLLLIINRLPSSTVPPLLPNTALPNLDPVGIGIGRFESPFASRTSARGLPTCHTCWIAIRATFPSPTPVPLPNTAYLTKQRYLADYLTTDNVPRADATRCAWRRMGLTAGLTVLLHLLCLPPPVAA